MTEEQDSNKQDLDETIQTNFSPSGTGPDPDATIPMAAPSELNETIPTNFNTDNMDTIGVAPTLPGNFNDSDTAATQMSPNQAGGAHGDDFTGQIWGDFELGRKIGQGGMGAVYLGKQISLDRPVAIKVLPSHLSHDESFRKRFELEAKAVAQLTSPYVIQVYGAGNFGGNSYFAMEFVEGKDLGERIKDGLRPTLEEAAKFILQAARGLAAAGEHNLIHRDIKPGNMMVTDKGDLKIMDFGLVKLKSEDGSSGGGLTMAGSVMGTVNYFSPEQGRGEECDQTTDIYALGVVLYQLLAGALPFTGSDATSIIYQHIHAEPRPLREINPNVPDSYQAIVSKCMQKDRRKRYQSANELIKDIELILEGAKPQHAPVEDDGTKPPGSVADKKGSNVGIVMLVIVIIAAAAGYYFYNENEKKKNQVDQSQNSNNNSNNNGTVKTPPDTNVDPKVKAGELLGTNQLEEAEILINQFLSSAPGDSDWLNLSKRLQTLKGEAKIKEVRKAIKVEDFELAASLLDEAEQLSADETVVDELRAQIRQHSGLAVQIQIIKSHLSAGEAEKAIAELDKIGVGSAKSDAKLLKDLRGIAEKMKGELETAHKTLASGDIDTARGLFQASSSDYPNAAARNGLKALASAATINRALNDNQVALAEEQMRELKVLIPDSPAIAGFENRIKLVKIYVDTKLAAKRGELERANELLKKFSELAPETAREKDLKAYVQERKTLQAFREAIKAKDLAAAKAQMEALKKLAPESESVQIARREYNDSKIEEESAKQAKAAFELKVKNKVSNIQALIKRKQPDFKAIDDAMKSLAQLAGKDRAEYKQLNELITNRRSELAISESFMQLDALVVAGKKDALPDYVAEESFEAILGNFIGKKDLIFKHRISSVEIKNAQATVKAVLTNGYDVAPENDINIEYTCKPDGKIWRIHAYKINK